MTCLTVVVSETSSPFPPIYPLPLLYDLEFDHEFDRGDGVFGVAEEYREEILDRVTLIRAAELDRQFDEELTQKEIDAIRDGLTLHFAFVGPSEVAMDWRGT